MSIMVETRRAMLSSCESTTNQGTSNCISYHKSYYNSLRYT